ncbi:MAG: hypothetical protein MZV63_20755 [Marinilabiliales bacterium]|nr:hypothetical protein [Marinilabiliales bacterium]
MKAEFLQHYYDIHHVPFRAWLIAWLPRLYAPGMMVRPLTNFLTGTSLFKEHDRVFGQTLRYRLSLPVTLQGMGRKGTATRNRAKANNGSKG